MEQFNFYERYPHLKVCQKEIKGTIHTLIDCFKSGGKLLVMGNGGSSSDAEHICGELMKGFLSKRILGPEDFSKYETIDSELPLNLQDGLPCISLGVSHSLISAFSNDMSWDYAFAQQVHVLADKNDVVFGISTSGNSPNVVNAFKVAKAKGLTSIGLTGKKGGELAHLSDICICAPEDETYVIQELHLPIYHHLCIEVERYFYE